MVSDITHISLYDITGTNIILSGDLYIYGGATVGDILYELGASNFGVTLVSETPGGEAVSNDARYADHFQFGGQASMYDATPQAEIIESLYNNGQEYKVEAVNGVPEGGTTGQVLTKTSNGCGWADVNAGGYYADVLVVGGGGGGGSYMGGGGGGGGVKECDNFMLDKTSYCIVVGAGGDGGTYRPSQTSGCLGGMSCFGKKIIAGGGGGGAKYQYNGIDGCCGGGGGGGGGCSGGSMAPGYGDNGNDGGVLTNYSSSVYMGGGGGGAAGHGGIFLPMSAICSCVLGGGSYGGPGYTKCFDGVKRCYGTGGNGGSYQKFNCTFRRPGGGTGGNGCSECGCTCQCYGAGGGGGAMCNGGNGYQGIIIVRYPSDGSYGINCATGGTVTTCTIDGTSYKIHTFTSNGTFCVVS